MLDIKKTDNTPFEPDRPRRKGMAIKKEDKKAFEAVLKKGENQEENNSGQKQFAVKSDKEVAQAFYGAEVAVEEGSREKGTLFQIPENYVEDEDLIAIREFPPKMREESLSALFRGYESKIAALREQNEFMAVPMPQKNEPQKKGVSVEFAKEQPDLNGVNTFVSTAVEPIAQPMRTDPVVPVSRAPQIQEVVEQIISKLYTIQHEGKTETVITLRHPPAFQSAQIVLTGFDSAAKEFNISFENLTQAGKQILDQNGDSLKLAMEQKGFTVHILTATTIQENRFDLPQNPMARDSGQKQGRQEQEHQQEEKES